MLGTNDARDLGSGGPEHTSAPGGLRTAACESPTAATLADCTFATNYTALLEVIKGLGRVRFEVPFFRRKLGLK